MLLIRGNVQCPVRATAQYKLFFVPRSLSHGFKGVFKGRLIREIIQGIDLTIENNKYYLKKLFYKIIDVSC